MKKRNGSGVAQSESEKAAEFNGQFTDVFTKSKYSQVPLLDRSVPFMEDIVVTREGVTNILKGLNPYKALEPDELHLTVFLSIDNESIIFDHHLRCGGWLNLNLAKGKNIRDGPLKLFTRSLAEAC